MKLHSIRRTLWGICIAALYLGNGARAQDEMRVWRNLQGREIKAALLEVRGPELTLRLENGTVSRVALASLSLPDQAFAKQAAVDSPKPAASAKAAPIGPLTWPAAVTVNPKALEIALGKQDPANREFEYLSGSFRFIAKAPLTGTVMKDVALDFELARQFMGQLPWGWIPRPKDGENFKVYLTETMQDFFELGGTDSSGGGSKDDYVFLKFSTLGLKKVGPRYAFDARSRSEGEVMGLTMRLFVGEMRELMQPWSSTGLEEFTRKIAYHKGAMKLSRLDSTLKQEVAAETRAKPDVKRMIELLHMPFKEQRSDVKQIRVENHLDAMMLVYFFGFMDGDGKGSRLHEYFRAIAQEALAWREFRDSNGKSPRPRQVGDGSFAEWAANLSKIVIADRTDEQLRAQMVAKFKAIGMRIE